MLVWMFGGSFAQRAMLIPRYVWPCRSRVDVLCCLAACMHTAHAPAPLHRLSASLLGKPDVQTQWTAHNVQQLVRLSSSAVGHCTVLLFVWGTTVAGRYLAYRYTLTSEGVDFAHTCFNIVFRLHFRPRYDG